METNLITLLSKRELEILKLVAEGFSSKQIAATLFISPRTVETHRKNIINKTNLGNLFPLVRQAVLYGVI